MGPWCPRGGLGRLTHAVDDRYEGSGWRRRRAWAEAAGHHLVALHRDEGVSGSLADRPALADALKDPRSSHAAGLGVPRLDQLACDLVVRESLLAEVRSPGWRALLHGGREAEASPG